MRHAAAAAALVVVTAGLVTQAMVGGRSASQLVATDIHPPPWRCHIPASADLRRRVLVLYDGGGRYGDYAAQTAVLASNFASHFARPVRQSVLRYRSGEMRRYAAVVYVGTTYGERLPAAFLADVRTGLRPVLWLGGNAYQLTDASYGQAHGWRVRPADRRGRYTAVLYRHARLTIGTRVLANIDVLDRAKATVLGSAATSDRTRVPWAVRSGAVTYVAETPFASGGSRDRSFAVADLMASLFGPVPERHRALLRLEDVGPAADPAQLLQVANLLRNLRIPYSVALYPVYLGPAGQHPRQRITLAQRPELADVIKYMLTNGATLVLHGYTHQLGRRPNPDNGQSGEDYEFLRVHENARHVLLYSDPVHGHVASWARHRIARAVAAIRAAGLPRPGIWQFPEYGAAPSEYRVAASMFAARFERGNYAERVDGRYKLQTLTEQSPPYLVRDVYGGPVLPETLGYVLGPHVHASGPGSVSAILAAAAAQRTAVRDNVAGVYYHPYLGTGPLRRLVEGIRREGYRFASDCAVLRSAP
ncbi:MAG TPA: DUF2334 domain-containing protein [Streptosporangiaceae bacterium]